MVLNGDKSRITAEALAKEEFTKVHHPLLDEPAEFVKAQASLGATVTPTARGPEARRRASKAMASRGPIRKEIFPKPQIPQYKKALHSDTLTNPRLLYNCHTWNVLTEGESTNLEVEYTKGYRQATGHETRNHAYQRVPNLQVPTQANRPPAKKY